MSDDENSCVICLSAILNDNQTLSCGHNFHNECITEFVRNERQRLEELYHETDDELRPQLDLNVRCPVCRQNIEE